MSSTATNIIKTPGRAANAVISMSLGGGPSQALNSAVENGYRVGGLTVVAADNADSDASLYLLALALNTVTVAATDRSNVRPAFSNFGSAVDIFSPGVDVLSTWIGSDTVTQRLGGNSMACPFVAGLTLRLVKAEGLGTPLAVASRLKGLATQNAVTNRWLGSSNLLTFNGAQSINGTS